MFITFEGIDLSGKSTQIKLLAEYLTKLKKKVVIVREPGGTKISEKIRDILLDKDHYEMADTTEFMLFSASRRQLTEEIIIPSLKKRSYVISDRYYDSSTAYQGYGGGLDLKMINSINNVASCGIEPDITILLEIDLQCWLSRKKTEGRTEDRIESKKIAYYRKVINGYKKIAEMNKKRFVIVDATASKQEVHENIVSALSNFTKKKKSKSSI
ncbi:MAG: dTMP kinase [Ignavibacteria bacterium]|nr:dTMP kinase [Ignavibacteria bacterium]